MDEEFVPLPDSTLNVIPTAKAIYNENPNIHTFLLI